MKKFIYKALIIWALIILGSYLIAPILIIGGVS